MAQYHLGLMYSKGKCVKQNKESAAKWYALSANKGNHFARHALALMLLEGDGIPVDRRQAVELLKKNDGFPPSMTSLGLIYVDGLGERKEALIGLDLLEKAAEFGEVKAQAALGAIYSEGRKGISPEAYKATKWYSKAFNWYSKSAQVGDIEAQVSLCEFYQQGKGTAKNISQAFYWCKKASEQGSSDAQIFIGGLLYIHGQELGQAPSEAIKWWKKAADQGEVEAFFLLGLAYQSGQVITRNVDLARSWYEGAAKTGHAEAIERLKSLK